MRLFGIALGALSLLAGTAVAAEMTAKSIVSLNRVTCAVKDPALAKIWEESSIFCTPTQGGLIVYDLKTNTVRRVLDQTMFTNADPNFVFNMEDIPVTKGSPMVTGADGIAHGGDKKTLYWTTLPDNILRSLDTSLLRDFFVPEASLQAGVKQAVILPSNTDGMTADREGNVCMTALTLNGLMKFGPARDTLSRFVYDKAMVWPDTFSWGQDGALHVISNHLNQFVVDTVDFDEPAVPNFRIWRIDGVGTPYTAL